jgi:hypothetical protein
VRRPYPLVHDLRSKQQPSCATQGLGYVCREATTNAWLLVGDDASFPDQKELAHVRKHWRYDDSVWTSAKQVQPGDLLFFYFLSPMKKIRFVARAASFRSSMPR